MSNRRKRRAREAQVERANEILRSKVRLDGVGEDPAVKAFLTKMPTAKQRESVELALALDRYLMGDHSVLEDPRYAEHINKMRARAIEMEEAERRFVEDPDKFFEDTWNKAEKIKATGDRKARIEAKAAAMYQDAREMAAANRTTKQLQLDRLIATGPKEDVECTGVMETSMINGTPTPRLLPIRVRIMHRHWDLKPGLNAGVPSVFAARYRQIRLALDEQREREVLLSGMGRSRDVEAGQDRISKQFGTKRQGDYVPQILAVDNAKVNTMDWKPFYYNDSTLLATGDTIEAVGRILHITGVHLKYTSSNTVGDRVMDVQVKDSDGDIVLEVRSGAVQAASLVRHYNFSPSLPNMAAFVDTDHLSNSLPDVWIPEGCTFIVAEQTQIDPGSDLMELQVFGEIAGYEA